MKLALVFVGGIHGVGKSSFCSELASALKLRHVSAGELIRQRREVTPSVDKRVQRINANQDTLVEALQAITTRESRILLDGHFCVFDSSHNVVQIPIQTFRQIAPLAAVVLHDDVKSIQRRLRDRDGRDYPPELLSTLQNAELDHSRWVCAAIGIQLCSLRPDMLFEATQFIALQLAARNL